LAVLTLSDSRTPDSDKSGDRVVQLAAEAGHEIVRRELIRDDRRPLEDLLRLWTGDGDQAAGVDAIVTTGGTGLAVRDQTVDVVRDWIDVELPGFGEHFRSVSIEEIGPTAMLSRAVAGRIGRTMIFCLPGSTGAVTTGMTRCVLPILRHAVGLVRG